MSIVNQVRQIVRLVIESNGKLLVAQDIRPNKGHHFLPGGGIEEGECMASAMSRELSEELQNAGIPSNIDLLGIMEHSWTDQDGKQNPEVNYVLQCNVAGLSSYKKVVSNEPHLAFHWQDAYALDDLGLQPKGLGALIPQWLEQNKIKIAPTYVSTQSQELNPKRFEVLSEDNESAFPELSI